MPPNVLYGLLLFCPRVLDGTTFKPAFKNGGLSWEKWYIGMTHAHVFVFVLAKESLKTLLGPIKIVAWPNIDHFNWQFSLPLLNSCLTSSARR